MANPFYIVGIDLGTSNTLVAYAPIPKEDERPDFQIFDIPQVMGPGLLESAKSLPSFLYLPTEREASDLRLPWDSSDPVVGAYARDRGAEVPGRQISSGKSWLCTDLVDREGPVLPWESQEIPERERLSPVAVSTIILRHVRNAWNRHFAENPLEDQEIFLTVPASFDAVARELTVRAAREAGLANLVLLEEPQAAFYSWLANQGDAWRDAVKAGDVFLVCDVGGGTSDFSLIRVLDADGRLELERMAVGRHLLVGGDNMDLALAYFLAAGLASKGQPLDSWQMRSLVQRSREAKEKLLAYSGETRFPLVIAGRGSGLIAGSIKMELSISELENLLMAGFFPEVSADEKPLSHLASGLSEFGLAYEADPAITKHLAAFLSGCGIRPSAVLFNGGVMKPEILRKRVLAIMSSWQEGTEIRELPNAAGDQAVALGAAYYGWSRKGKGVRIRSGLNRSYYIGVAAAMPAIPGIPMPKKALCIAPFGMEEGSEVNFSEKTYMLNVGLPVSFELLASVARRHDTPGLLVDDWHGEIEAVTQMETTLEGEEGARIPVSLRVRVTEVGTLEFFCVSVKDDKSWKLAFHLRHDAKQE